MKLLYRSKLLYIDYFLYTQGKLKVNWARGGGFKQDGLFEHGVIFRQYAQILLLSVVILTPALTVYKSKSYFMVCTQKAALCLDRCH